MANIAWPLSPSVGDTYTFNSITYRWTGTTWSPGTAPISLTGPTGGTGPTGATGPTATNANSGILTYVSTTAIKFAPFNGDQIKISGTLYTIPSAGIAGVANTNVFVNGVAAQNLAVNTLYYVYAFNNSGTITADFSTTAHATSATAGNVGVEIKSGDDTRTLIGMIRTNASSQFVDSAAQRFVLSWFNRRVKIAQGQFSTDRTTTSLSFVEINSEIAIGFLMWGDCATYIASSGAMFNSGVGSGFGAIYVDGAQLSGITYATSAAAGYGAALAVAAALGGLDTGTEGYHSATLYGKTFSGTQTYTGLASGTAACTLLGLIFG